MTDLRVELGKSVRNRRKAQKLSQEKLAREIKMSRETVRAIEAGTEWPQWNTVRKLAEALRTDPYDLFSGVYLRHKTQLVA